MVKRFALRPVIVDKESGQQSAPISTLEWLVLSYTMGTGLFLAVYLGSWGFSWPEVLPKFWTAVLLGSLANIAIQFFNAKASSLSMGEVSLTAPLQAMTPGLITFLAITLGEFPGKIGVIGIVAMMLGSYILLWDKTPLHWTDYFGPLKRLRLVLDYKRLTPEEQSKTLAVLLGLGSATLGTVGLLFDGLYTRRGINTQGLVVAVTTLTAILSLTYLVWFLWFPDNVKAKQSRAAMTGNEKRKWVRKILLLGLAFGVLWVVGILLIQPVFKETFIAYVGTLKRFSVLFTVLAGYLFFGETEFKKRLWAALFIVAGAILISMDDLPGRVTSAIEVFGL